MSKSLPSQPSLEHLKKEAKQLLKAHHAGEREACARLQRGLPRLGRQPLEMIRTTRVSLQEVQHVVAGEYGFRTWAALVAQVTGAARPAARPVSGPQPYRLRITATEPGAEVDFTGTILVRHPERSWYALAQRTPFELQAETEFLGGAVCATAPTGDVQVEVIGPLQGQAQTLLRGSGRHIVFGEQVAHSRVPRFIWVF